MTRRRLWSLVALVCAALVLPGLVSRLPADLAAARVASDLWAAARMGLTRLPAPSAGWLPPASATWFPALLVAAGCLVLAITLVLVARRGGMPHRVRRLSRRGLSVAAIARRTGLAQDAIRDLLGAEMAGMASGSFDHFLSTSAVVQAQEAR
jgi:hypothetical protein